MLCFQPDVRFTARHPTALPRVWCIYLGARQGGHRGCRPMGVPCLMALGAPGTQLLPCHGSQEGFVPHPVEMPKLWPHGGVWLWLHHSVVLRSLLSSGETSSHSPATTLPIWGVQPSHPAWEQGIHTPWRLQAPAPIWVTSEHELSLPIWSPCTASGKIYIVLKHSTVLSTEMIELQMLTRCRTLFLLLKT